MLIILSLLYISFLVVGVVQDFVPVGLLIWVLWLSFVTFLLYMIDKGAATQGWWRQQESLLHTFSLLGGWPGAMIAQQLFHHKTRKESFRVLFWGTVVVNLLITLVVI